nr:hypothetical protein [Micromonospora sp. WMMA1996]
MTADGGFLRLILNRFIPSQLVVAGLGQRIQTMEQEAARRRLLIQARGGKQYPGAGEDPSKSPPRRVSYDEYLSATALTLARRHRPAWSWRRWRWVCRCGDELPCRVRHRVPIGVAHWPGEER